MAFTAFSKKPGSSKRLSDADICSSTGKSKMRDQASDGSATISGFSSASSYEEPSSAYFATEDTELDAASITSKNNKKHTGASFRSSITVLAPQPRKTQNSLEDFSINKLNFKSLGLFGRDDELDMLSDCLTRCRQQQKGEEQATNDTQHRQMVLISGYSGAGKTVIVETALQNPIAKAGKGLYVRGKFEQYNDKPYSGLVAACSELCGQLLALQISNAQLLTQIRATIVTELGSELPVLFQFIVALPEILHDDTTIEPTTIQNHSPMDSKNRFHFAFQRFLRVIASAFPPLVMVLDDLQWADSSTLDLLQTLIADRENSNLFLVGIYRSNEVHETHILSRTLDNIRTKSSKDDRLDVTEIKIGNLDITAVHGIIQHLLSDDDAKRTKGLAELCFQATNGNAFYLLRFLSMLTEENLLQYNFGALKWMWDEQDIMTRTKATENVVDLLMKEMQNLPMQKVLILQIMACLGSSFRLDMFHLIREELWPSQPHDEKDIPTLAFAERELTFFEEEGYLRVRGHASGSGKCYAWVHDKVLEAAISLVPANERAAFQSSVGQVLLAKLDKEHLDASIFVVANLLNSDDIPKDKVERIELAKLNYKASRKAVLLSAFDSASRYAGRGLENLGSDSWSVNYELSLNLHSAAAEAEGFVGNVERMEQYCKQIFEREDCPIEHKFRAYHTWLDSIGSRGETEESVQFGLSILRKFRCAFPKNSISILMRILANVIKIKASMKTLDVEAIEEMDDPVRIELMKFLDRLSTCCYVSDDDLLPLVVFRLLTWTRKYGWCEFSPVAFSSTAVILSGVLQDYEAGNEYGKQALQLMKKSRSRLIEARIVLCVYAFVFHRTMLSRECAKALLGAYEVGMQAGDTESAMWAVYMWILLRYQAGESLEVLSADCRIYGTQMQDLKREKAFQLTMLTLQSYLNLMGCSRDPCVLVGEALEDGAIASLKKDKFIASVIPVFQGFAYTFYGAHIKHADEAWRLGTEYVEKSHPGSPNIMVDTLMKGVSSFAAARQTGARKYRAMGLRLRKKVKNWIHKGNPNVRHYGELLDAELAALKGRKERALKHYQAAVIQAARGGYSQDAALASERLGEFQLNVLADKDEAIYRLREAIRYYKDWGAHGKVAMLEESYSHMWPRPTEILAGGDSELGKSMMSTSALEFSSHFEASSVLRLE